MNVRALVLSLFKIKKKACTEKHEYKYKASSMKIKQCFLQFMSRCYGGRVFVFFSLAETYIIIFSQEQI